MDSYGEEENGYEGREEKEDMQNTSEYFQGGEKDEGEGEGEGDRNGDLEGQFNS